MSRSFLWAACGTGFTFLMTLLGIAVPCLIKPQEHSALRRLVPGFAAGVMLASGVWSLLIPAMAQARRLGLPGWLPAGIGAWLGILALIRLDAHLPCPDCTSGRNGTPFHTAVFVLAVALHNIPEGMAAGLSAALAAENGGGLSAALALPFSVGIQNLPEGAAIVLPMLRSGMSRRRAAGIGVLTGLAEPFFGMLAVAMAAELEPLLPWLLSFAAGAVLYVVVEELIPEANLRHNHRTHSGTFGFMAGFHLIMILNAGGA